MKWSLKVGQVAGIGIFMHWTFLILLAWVAYANIAAGESTLLVMEGIGFILALFLCVVLHELGHALMARRYGVATRDITLLPIGGLARLERIPEAPWQEFWVAVAGPAVNVAIAAILCVVLLATGQPIRAVNLTLVGAPFLQGLLWVNVVLVLFNLLPAFPMDGGRVLCALLALKMPRVRATHVAADVGQMMAIVFGIAGFLGGNWILMFIALFVYLAAHGESQAVEMRSICKSYRVHDAMVRQFHALSADEPIGTAARDSLNFHQDDFPVMDGDRLYGVLLKRDLVKALASGASGRHVSEFARQDCPIIDEKDPLDRALDKMTAYSCPILLVQGNGQLTGLLSEEHLGQWMMYHSSVHERLPLGVQQVPQPTAPDNQVDNMAAPPADTDSTGTTNVKSLLTDTDHEPDEVHQKELDHLQESHS